MVGRYNIGEFSRITRLSVKTLRFYDEVGLLKPVEVSLSGYRLYEAAQLPTVRLIQRLKALEFTLEEIRDFLQGRTALEAMLERQRHLLEKRAAHYQQAAARAGAWLQALSRGEEALSRGEEALEPMRQYQVVQSAIPPVTLAAIRKTGSVAEAGERLQAVRSYVASRGGRIAGPPMAVYYSEEFDPDRTDFAIGWPVAQPLPAGETPSGTVESITLPGGQAVSLRHVGPYEELGDAYRALLDHLHAHGLTTAGPPRERYLSDPQTTDPSQYVTEIQIPIA